MTDDIFLFDVDAEIKNLAYAPAKVANPEEVSVTPIEISGLAKLAKTDTQNTDSQNHIEFVHLDSQDVPERLEIKANLNDIDYWFEHLKLCNDRQEVFSLLDKFRPLSWNDYQRAEMSRAYHRQLTIIR